MSDLAAGQIRERMPEHLFKQPPPKKNVAQNSMPDEPKHMPEHCVSARALQQLSG